MKENKIRIAKFGRILVGALIFLFICNFASAFEIYTGGIDVVSVNNIVIVGNAEVSVVSDYIIRNTGASSESASIDFKGVPDNAVYSLNGSSFTGKISLNGGESKKLNIVYKKTLSSDETSFKLDSGFTMNGKIPNLKTDLIFYSLSFSNPSMQLAGSYPKMNANDNNVYTYSARNSYITPISFNWINFVAKISLQRDYSSFTKNGDKITITAVVKNEGDNDLTGIELSDRFPAGVFSPGFPSEEFTFVNDFQDPSYVWKKSINLPAGKSMNIVYSVFIGRDNILNLQTSPLNAYIGETFIVSDGAHVLTPNMISTNEPAGSSDVAFNSSGNVSDTPAGEIQSFDLENGEPLTSNDLQNLENAKNGLPPVEDGKDKFAKYAVWFTIIAIVLIILFLIYFIFKFYKNKRGNLNEKI